MCRYAAYLGPPLLLSELIYKPTNSLVHQATDALLTPTRVNADGFGVGWYVPEISPEPVVFKDVTPVWNNYNLGELADKVRSSCIVVHIRAAKSFDPVGRENCHPFRRGRLLWMHNGDIPGRVRLARQVNLLASDEQLGKIRGNTDTEYALTLFLTHLEREPEEPVSAAELATALRKTVCQIASWHAEAGDSRPLELNFCVTTGTQLVATRFAISDRTCPTVHWKRFEGADGAPAVLVSSEPLSRRDGWHAVETGQLLTVSSGLEVESRPLGIEAPVDSASPARA